MNAKCIFAYIYMTPMLNRNKIKFIHNGTSKIRLIQFQKLILLIVYKYP